MDNSLHNYLQKLVAYKTEAGDSETKDCLDYVKNELENMGVSVSTQCSNDIYSLIAGPTSKNNFKVLLQAHLDVVPAKPEQYALREANGKLYGRGVYDMKFAAACYLKLVDDLKDELNKYDFGIMFTFDEEVGGENGVKYLLDQGYDAEVCILPDGGDNWGLEVSCKGVWLIKIKSIGKTAHGSRPWEGNCAINNLLNTLADIKRLFEEQGPDTNSLTISQIQGGLAINQVPDYAEATLDMRFINKDEYQSKRQQLEQLLKQARLEFETMAQVNPCQTDMANPHIIKFLEVAERVRDQPLGQARSLGASDAHYFADHGIPVILLRPDGGGPHSDEEWIDKAGLEQFYEVIKAYVMETSRLS